MVIAPELFFGGGSYSPKCDIYSLAIVLWELVVRTMIGSYQRPYSEYSNLKFDFQIVTHVTEENFRPSFPPPCPESLKALITRAWAADQVKNDNYMVYIFVGQQTLCDRDNCRVGKDQGGIRTE